MHKKLRAMTSNSVIDEVAFVILIEKGCEILSTNKTREVREKIKKDKKFAKKCYQAVKQFLTYIDFLQKVELRVIETTLEDINFSVEMGSDYRLLPHDALHVAVMGKYEVKHIATSDLDFERFKGITIWSPREE